MKFELLTTLSLSLLLTGCASTYCGDDVYTHHPIFSDTDPSGKGAIELTYSTDQPTIKGDRFYMKNKAFSITIPAQYQKNGFVILEDAWPPSWSMAIIKAYDGGMLAVDTFQLANIVAHSPDRIIELSKNRFDIKERKNVPKQLPGSRIIYEGEWRDEQLSGYFVLMDCKGGATTAEGELDTMRGYLISIINDAYVCVTIEDGVLSYQSNGKYQSLDLIKTELLKQATEAMKSYRAERTLSSVNIGYRE